MRVLISGAGIAGLTLAHGLQTRGFTPIVVEHAPHVSRKGFLIGIRGPSISVLKQLGVLEQALAKSIDTIPYDLLSSKGARINTGHYLSYKQDVRGKLGINRADLQRVLYDAVKDRAEVRFNTTVEAVEQTGEAVHVTLSGGQTECFDLLIGADGVHSTVRRLAFGEGFERDLPAQYCAFIGHKRSPLANSYVQFSKGMMSVLYNLSDSELGGIFVLKQENLAGLSDREKREVLIQKHRGQSRPIAEALENLRDDTTLFVDRLTQVVMPKWFDRRVALVGDAAYSLTPTSGFGATAALVGAYVLAEELARDPQSGLAVYDQRLRRSIEKKQRVAARTTRQITTGNPVAIAIRDTLLRLIPDSASYKTKQVETFGIPERA